MLGTKAVTGNTTKLSLSMLEQHLQLIGMQHQPAVFSFKADTVKMDPG
jgi:hypothetical protein